MSALNWFRRPRFTQEELTTDAVTAARRLLGATLWHRSPEGLVGIRLTETEAYGGTYRGHPDDASHAYRGETNRNRPMFGPAGHMYVYLVYGLHHCANIVVDVDGMPAAVLLRAGKIIYGDDLVRARRAGIRPEHWTDGPGKLARALGISTALSGKTVLSGNLQLRHGKIANDEMIVCNVRRGIDYATYGKSFPWQFKLIKKRKND